MALFQCLGVVNQQHPPQITVLAFLFLLTVQ